MTFLGGLNRGLQTGLNLGMDVADRRKSREIGLARAEAELELLRLRATGQAMENAERQERSGLAMEPTTVRQHPLETGEFGAQRSAFVRDLGGALSGEMKPGPRMGEGALGSREMGIPEPRGLPPLTPGVTRIGPSADDRKELAEFDMTTAIADELQGRTPGTSRRAALLAAGGHLPLPKPETPRLLPWQRDGFASEADYLAFRRREGAAGRKPEDDGGISPQDKDEREYIQQRIRELTRPRYDNYGVEVPGSALSLQEATTRARQEYRASVGQTPRFDDVSGGSSTGGQPKATTPADRWEELVDSGLSEADATAQVRREFGQR